MATPAPATPEAAAGRLRGLVTTAGRARRIASVTLVIGLLLAGTVVANQVARWWQDRVTTTDAPPPTPLADAPPAQPTTELWRAYAHQIHLLPGGYVVLVEDGVTVRDLYTGKVRWQRKPRDAARTSFTAAAGDQLLVQFGDETLAFDIASGQPRDAEQFPAGRDLIADGPERPGGTRIEGCTDRWDEQHDPESESWLVLLQCGDRTDLVSLDADSGAIRWQSTLPLPKPDYLQISLTGLGYGQVAVIARDWDDLTGDAALLSVDLATGSPSQPMVRGKDTALQFQRPEEVVATPVGLCGWKDWSDLQVGCLDLATGQERWLRDREPVRTWDEVAAVVLEEETLLLIVDGLPARWLGYRLTDGELQFDLDRFAPWGSRMAHFGDGVLVLVGQPTARGEQAIAVYGDGDGG